MKTVGIICEYNPFHLGHKRQFDLVREAFGQDTNIVCVMSGNYVQRGAPAMWDKFTRASTATSCGADLVLELPVTKVLQSAEGFARGGVEILSKSGIADILCFGAECGDAGKLMALAKQLNSPEAIASLQEHLSQGLSYPAARQLAANDTDSILSSPNNILGLEYCRAILHCNSSLIPFAVQRNGNYHSIDADSSEPSATAIRALFPNDDWMTYVPNDAANILKRAVRYTTENGERAMLARLRALTDEEWEHCAHGTEGLWSKAMKACRQEHSLENIIDAIKSKRYPRTRIQRLLMCAYLGISHEALQAPLFYTRLLAASERGRKLLKTMKASGNLTVVNPGERPDRSDYYRLETRSADLFTLFCTEDIFPCATEQNTRLKL